MDTIIQQISNRENLYWAWEQAKIIYSSGDIWFNEIDVARFESNLDNELNNIKARIENIDYKISPIRPIPFPKSQEDKRPRARQTFLISVQDQVAWLAAVNIIGSYLDPKMPFWSFGNRLYISVFYKVNPQTNKKELRFGWYRHTSKYLYRKWNQSWPFYRRSIAITARIMANQRQFKRDLETFKKETLEEKERELFDQNNILPNQLRIAYFQKEYWTEKLTGDIFWAGIDLEKFYPNVNLQSIISNFRKHLPPDKRSNELERLLSNLLIFPLNGAGWTKGELKRIDIDINHDKLSGIPTGLFVAGFLANVALLEVDEKVNAELRKKRNIAQFRFVDDHVILADNFENLVKWISWYQTTLNTSKTGVKINIKKTEPDSLRMYFEKVGIERLVGPKRESKKIRELYFDAREKTELDPHFLTPLMTQTLAKVSQIAQINFDLLDEEEQNNLIGDIEHLLVAEFPDQELRRDTRVSFAASMLSRVVPKKDINITELYNSERKVVDLTKTLRQELKNLKELAKRAENYPMVKKKIQKIRREIKNAKIERNQIEDKLRDAEEKIKTHTFNLLLKAVKENHEKVRLWTKSLEFCRRMGEENLKEMFNVIDYLERKNIATPLSTSIIYSLLRRGLVEEIIKTYQIVNGPDSSPLEKERAKTFFSGVIRLRFLECILPTSRSRIKFFEKESVEILKFTLGCVLFLLINEAKWVELIGKYKMLVRKFGIVDWNEDPSEFTKATSRTLGSFAWWVLGRLSDKLVSKPNLLWENVVDRLSINDQTSSAIIELYPKHIPVNVLEKLNKYLGRKFLMEEEGWLYEVQVGIEDRKLSYSNTWLKRIRQIRKSELENMSYVSVYEWGRWCQRKLSGWEGEEDQLKDFFDPRLSEWTALEIAKQIAELLNEKIHFVTLDQFSDKQRPLLKEKTNYYKVHPSNYLIPRTWPKYGENKVPTWEEWRSSVAQNKVTLKDQEDFIHDSRYTPIVSDPFDVEDTELSVVNGLGMLLLGLLVKSFDLPPYWNPKGLQTTWLILARQKLEGIPISSWTSGVIEGCFSRRNRESRLLRVFQKHLLDVHDDTIMDPPEILCVKDFIENVNQSQRVLYSYQLTVQEHQPRQLVPVSLIQLTREYNPYEETENIDR